MEDAAVVATARASQPAPRRPDLAAATVLVLLCQASLWVGFAAGGAAGDYDERSPVFRVLTAITVRASVLAVLLALFALVLVLRPAVCDAGFRKELIRLLQASRVSAGSMLREAIVRAFLAALPFVLLRTIGILELSPVKGSRTGRIGAMLIVVGTVGSTAISCIFIFPLMALKLWRMKLGGAAVAGSNV